jgi:excisionase family DNA binding protein
MEERIEFDSLPQVLTTREGALVLRCSKAHFCNLLNGRVRGIPRIPFLRLGRRRLVRKETLIQWIEQVEGRSRLGV